MKKLLILIVVLAIAWVGINYLRTGQIGLLPGSMSEGERRLHDLESELAAVDAEINSAGRMAGMTGMDMTTEVAALLERKERLEKQIAEARKEPRRE